jgi:hypothetical protein
VSFIRTLNKSNIEGLIEGRFAIQFSISNIEMHTDNQNIVICNDEVSGIICCLKQMSSRDEVLQYIETIHPNRKMLEAIVKALDIPFNKRDDQNRLKEKIIEGTVGYKLRSDAIQGMKKTCD